MSLLLARTPDNAYFPRRTRSAAIRQAPVTEGTIAFAPCPHYRVPGIGPRRIAAIRAALTTALGRPRPTRRPGRVERPSVELLLDVDAQYRTRAVRDELHRIAPRRFNPEGEAWLPIMHLEQDGWHFTALYSNTALAHELQRTHDWVVIYYYDGDHRERQCTVVTETLGAL